MTRSALSTFLILLGSSGAALAQVAHVEGEHSPVTVVRAASGAPGLVADAEPAAGLAAQTGSPSLNVLGQRRRGSYVGYLDDAVVSSKIRMRFEMGRRNTTPDRAEFFYAKCGCYRGLPANDPARDPDAKGPGTGIPDYLDFQQFSVLAEYATPNNRFSAFGEVPIRSLQPQGAGGFGDQNGISDVRAGAKFGFASTEQMSLTAQVKAFFASGDARSGLGTGHASIEPSLLYQRNLSDRASIATQVALWIPFGGSNGVPTNVDGTFAGNVLSYGIGPSFEVYSTENVGIAPVVELVGWHVLSGYQTAATPDAGGTNIVNLKFGGRANWSNGSSIYGGYGRALTEADWYEDIFRFEYRFTF